MATLSGPGFNEAAGIPRGRLVALAARHARSRASMRPRVFPAEDGLQRVSPAERRPRFNEAAGIPRGRLGEQEGTGVFPFTLQ